MSKSLKLTLQTLTESRNEAATAALLRGLDSVERTVFEGCLSALVARRSKTGHLAVLRRWHTLSSSQLDLLRTGRGRMGAALREALLSTDGQLANNAYEFALAFSEFDVLPTLVNIAEQRDNRRAEPALMLITQLVKRLSHLLCGGRDAYERRDPKIVARTALEALERSVERYRNHRRNELVEAFVTLAGPTSPLLLHMIDAPHHPCYAAVMCALDDSENVGIVKLLAKLLETSEAPASIIGVVSHRTDAAFVNALLQLNADGANPMLRKNLTKIQSLAFLDPPHNIEELSAEQQAAAIRLFMYSGAEMDQKLAVAERLLSRGAVEGRLAACKLLTDAAGDHANRLILMAVADEDPQVQAAAASQLRDRHIPGAMSKLLALAESPHPEVAAAAREGLADFNFASYLLRYDTLDEASRLSAGQLAVRIDPEVVPQLRKELESPSRRARLRALEIIETLELAPQVADALVERLRDTEHLVRTAAAEALQHCDGADVRDALLASLDDRSMSVQRAAQSSLERLGVKAEIAGPQPVIEEEQP